jgi:hypothetical protein
MWRESTLTTSSSGVGLFDGVPDLQWSLGRYVFLGVGGMVYLAGDCAGCGYQYL